MADIKLFTESEIEINVTYDVTIRKYSPSELKELVTAGVAIDITNATDTETIKEPYTVTGYALSFGKPYGKLFVGLETYKLYAITKPSLALQVF